MTARESGTRRRASIRTRLVAQVAVLAAAGLLGSGAAALVVEQRRLDNRIRAALAQEIAEFSELMTRGTDPQTGAPFASAERLVTLALERNVPDRNETQVGFLRSSTLAPLSGSTVLHTDPEFRRLVTQRREPAFGEWSSPSMGRISYAVMPVVAQDQVSHYAVAYFVDREQAEMLATIRIYGAAGLLSWLAIVAGSWVWAGRIVRPIKELEETAAAINDSDLSRRLEVEGQDEVAALGRTFNAMLDRIDVALASQRRMLDDAGHELRTPITVIRGHLELMDPEDPADVLETRELAVEELDRMRAMVNDLLLLAKAQRPDFLTLTQVDIADLVRRTQAKATALAERDWSLDECSAGTLLCDPHRLAQALLQFASNAVAVTQEGDTIAFGCCTTVRGVRLWVRDTGPGVPQQLRHEVFDRWVTGGSHRREGQGGSGLGLAIVAAIAAAHDGSASVHEAYPRGALFAIDIPGMAAPAASTRVGTTRPDSTRPMETTV